MRFFSETSFNPNSVSAVQWNPKEATYMNKAVRLELKIIMPYVHVGWLVRLQRQAGKAFNETPAAIPNLHILNVLIIRIFLNIIMIIYLNHNRINKHSL